MTSDVSEGTAFADVAVHLQDLALGDADVDHLVSSLAGYAAARLGGHSPGLSCGITLTRPKKPAATVGSDPLARLLGQLERKYDDGPGTRAVRTSGTVVVPDLRREERWPTYVRATRRQGILSLVSLPLLLDAPDCGVLSLYSEEPAAFDTEGTTAAEAFVAQASKSLRLVLRMDKLRDARDGLNAAMSSRTVIDLATGAIMAQSRCSQADAFKVLREASNTRNTKLRDVAAGMISALAGDAETFTYFDE